MTPQTFAETVGVHIGQPAAVLVIPVAYDLSHDEIETTYEVTIWLNQDRIFCQRVSVLNHKAAKEVAYNAGLCWQHQEKE